MEADIWGLRGGGSGILPRINIKMVSSCRSLWCFTLREDPLVEFDVVEHRAEAPVLDEGVARHLAVVHHACKDRNITSGDGPPPLLSEQTGFTPAVEQITEQRNINGWTLAVV